MLHAKTLKPGDKVKVKENIQVHKAYSGLSVVEEMLEYKGKVLTVKNTFNSAFTCEESGNWHWNEFMVDYIAEESNGMNIVQAMECVKAGEHVAINDKVVWTTAFDELVYIVKGDDIFADYTPYSPEMDEMLSNEWKIYHPEIKAGTVVRVHESDLEIFVNRDSDTGCVSMYYLVDTHAKEIVDVFFTTEALLHYISSKDGRIVWS